MSTAPGWYPDPHDPAQARYWDGEAWTDRTQALEALEAEAPDPEPRGATPSEPAKPPASSPGSTPPAGPAGGGSGDQPPTGTPPGGAWWRRPWAWGGAVAILVLVVAGIAVLTLTGEAEAEVILEPTAAAGEDPFTDSVATEEVELAGGELEPVSGAGSAVESLSGATPELYGGTGEEAVCDAEALVSFLGENPDKAAAFAAIVGVDADEVGDYVAGLTAVVLREDTRVTNHGFTDGAANPFDAVLQAGTAVMVDERGVPRVRCACGNPLAEPAATASRPEYSGEAWDGFDSQRLVAVSAAEEELDSLTLVNVRTGERYEQRVGSGRLTEEEVMNLRMPPFFDSLAHELLPAARWRDGVHPDSATGPSGEPRGGVIDGLEFDGSPSEGEKPRIAFGDLDGDGREDAVVVRISYSCGASCVFLYDAAAFDANGQPLGTVFLDGVGQIAKLRVLDGGFELDARTWQPDDARVTGPSGREQLRFEWNGSEFEEVG